MSRLAFLSPPQPSPELALCSPLRHALGEGVTDVSHLGKLELRGPLDGLEPPSGELLRLGPTRALLISDGPAASAPEWLEGTGVRAYDMTAALAGFEFEGEDVFRRLSELDPRRLPAVGSIARGTRAVIEHRGAGTFRVFVAQELGHHVVEVVLDALRGLGR